MSGVQYMSEMTASGVQSMPEMSVSSGARPAEVAAFSAAQLLSSAGVALLEIGLEAVLIAIGLYLCLRCSRFSLLNLLDRRLKSPKVVVDVAAAPDCSKEVRAWIGSVLGKDGITGQLALDKYETFVRGQHVNLRQHVADGQAARALYSALVEGAVDLAVAGGPSDADSYSSAKPTTSRLLADMRIFGFPRHHEFYSSILKAHVAGRLSADSLWLHDVMLADGVTPDRTMYIQFLSVAVSCGQDQKAIAFFKEIVKTGPPPMRACMNIVKVYAKKKDWKSSVDLLAGLKSAAVHPDAMLINTVLGICVSEHKVDLAENLLTQWADSVDVVSCNIVLKGFSQRVNSSKSDKLLQRMLDHGPAPNTISFNTIMDCAVRDLAQAHASERPEPRRGDAERDRLTVGEALARRPWQLLDQLLRLGLDADRYTCSTLVKGLHLTGCSAQDIDRVVALMRKVGPTALHCAGQGASVCSAETSNGRLLEVIFNTLLDACVSIRDLDRMAEIFKMMSAFEVEASAVTFSTLIKAFGQAGKLDHCHEVWQNMMDANVKPTIVTFGCYIDVCVRNLDIVAAEHIFHSMGEAGVRPNSVIYTSMIRGFANMKKPAKAFELYKRMQAQGIQSSTVTFNSVLDSMVRQINDPAALQEFVEDMQAASMAPDLTTYSILIKASCNAGRLDSAISLFRQLRRQGLTFDEVAFNTLLLACSKADEVEIADEVLGEMRSIGTAPTQVTVSILVKMYGKAKRLDKAIELSKLMEIEYGMTPNLHVYTCLIQACVRNRQLRKSWEVFGNMLRTGVAPDAITYGTLIHGCIYQNKFEEAMALVRHAHALAESSCLMHSLALDPSLVKCVRNTGPMVRLQQDVLKMLMAALKRKGQASLLAELEAISQKHGHAYAHAPSGKD